MSVAVCYVWRCVSVSCCVLCGGGVSVSCCVLCGGGVSVSCWTPVHHPTPLPPQDLARMEARLQALEHSAGE